MGGILSRDLVSLVKSPCSTLQRLLGQSYESIANLSMASKHMSSASHNISSAFRTGVISGNTFHMFHAVFIPLHLKSVVPCWCILLVHHETSVMHLLFLDPVKWLWRAKKGNRPACKNRTRFTTDLILELNQWK